MRILIADDEPRVRSALRLLLRQESDTSEIYEAGDGEALMRCATKKHLDLVILDWNLPKTGGYTALKALRAAQPDVSIIVLNSRSETRNAALATGADAFVSKGDPPERLLATIAMLDKRTSDLTI
ncbi:MAG: response regulator transcription factor [Anaerolineae bacterium]|nr:response regulator transcription factor [Anaerolineae bacterium]